MRRWIAPIVMILTAQAVVYADKKPAKKKPPPPPAAKKGPLWDGTFLFDAGNGERINTGVTQCQPYLDHIPPACAKLYKDADEKRGVIAPPACVQFADTSAHLLCPTACGNMSSLVVTNDTMSFDVQWVPEGNEFDSDRPRTTRHISVPLGSKNRQSFEIDTKLALDQPMDIVNEGKKKHLTEVHVMAGFGVQKGHCQPSGWEENGRSVGLIVELWSKGGTDFDARCDLNAVGKDFTVGAFCGEGHQCHTSGWGCKTGGDCCSGTCDPIGNGFKGGRCRGN